MSTSIALIRGNSLTPWEGKLWEGLPAEYSVTGFCSRNNLYPVDTLNFPVVRLPASTDTKVSNGFTSYVLGRFQSMRGLPQHLAPFQIAHTAEIYNYYSLQAVRAKKLFPALKVVITVWDNSPARFDNTYVGTLKPPRWWSARMKQVVREVVAGADMLLPVSESSRAVLSSYGTPAHKMRTLMPGIATYAAGDGHAVMQRYNITAPFYLMVNRLTKEKGIYDVLTAWKDFVRQVSEPVRLVAIGAGPEKQQFVRAIHEAGLEKSIQYIERMPNHEVRQLYSHAEALILASVPTPKWEEQFGFVLAEAMTSGCPVISTRSGAIPEVVGSGGLLVAPSAPHEITAALLSLRDPAVRTSLVSQAAHSRERFSTQRFQRELVSIYSTLV